MDAAIFPRLTSLSLWFNARQRTSVRNRFQDCRRRYRSQCIGWATYTFRLTQASLAIQRAALQCYVRRPVLREMLEWDATSAIRVSLITACVLPVGRKQPTTRVSSQRQRQSMCSTEQVGVCCPGSVFHSRSAHSTLRPPGSASCLSCSCHTSSTDPTIKASERRYPARLHSYRSQSCTVAHRWANSST